jgi:predicted amidophosphoribosyltransferase
MIARHLATMLEKNDVALPVSTDILIRAKHTAPQSGTEHVAERKENIRGAFAVKDPDAVRGKNILLIDDVATSGATFLEAALTLKAAGAQKIICLAAAKA